MIDSLLSVYPIVKLDVLYEKAFCIFNKIYRLAWNEAAKCFSISKNCRIKYTAYELGVIIRCLGRIAKWADGHEQQMWIETTLQQFYLKKIFTNFIKTNRKTITSLIDLYCSLNIQDKSYEYYDVRKIKWSPIFPNKISFNYPGPTFNWTHSYHIVALKNPLFLCSCILDLLLDDSEAEDDNQLNSFFELLMEMLSINRDG